MIRIRGARQHNLRGLNLEIPRNAVTVVTGPSGSGKSSLAFDTIHAESQRRFVEALGIRARQALEVLPRPEVDAIEGLPATIAVGQERSRTGPRSTVGTATEIQDFLRILYARLGVAHCPDCNVEVRAYTVQEIVDQAERVPGSRLLVSAPLARACRDDLGPLLDRLRRDGFARVILDGEIQDLGERVQISGDPPHDLDVVVDRLVVRSGSRARLTEAVELALRTASGLVCIAVDGVPPRTFSESPRCERCGLVLAPLTPRSFSWNTPEGACSNCDGLGVVAAEADTTRTARAKTKGARTTRDRRNPNRNRRDDEDANDEPEDDIAPMHPCPACRGARLRRESLAVRLLGRSIADLMQAPVASLVSFFDAKALAETPWSESARSVAAPLFAEIASRLRFLDDVGVGYLSLARTVDSLSSGEAQRIRLATRLGSRLVGVLYVLDEPSAGLHPRDTSRLVATLERLRDDGNTVLVVEHDLGVIRAAHHVVELGPGAGTEGGSLLFAGPPMALAARPDTVTGPWLAGRPMPPRRAPEKRPGKSLTIRGVTLHNLRDLTVTFPLGRLVAITGVSGSGKSSLVMRALLPSVRAALRGEVPPFEVEGSEALVRALAIDASPIGRTPRSTPATYVGLMTPLRELYAMVPEARARGYDAARFSANLEGGRCEACEGQGLVRVDMHLLPDVHVECAICGGTRYNRDTLEIRYRGLSIADALALTVERATEIFGSVPALRDKLVAMRELGLGYLALGQSATTLSGGEAQRIKLARELARKSASPTLYVLDEPTTGLHPSDVVVLLDVLDRLVHEGHSVLVIEHAMELVARADHVIDLGPEGGDAGGRIVAEGSPAEVARTNTPTGQALAEILQRPCLASLPSDPEPAEPRPLSARPASSPR